MHIFIVRHNPKSGDVASQDAESPTEHRAVGPTFFSYFPRCLKRVFHPLSGDTRKKIEG